jgi:hypothetical protein
MPRNGAVEEYLKIIVKLRVTHAYRKLMLYLWKMAAIVVTKIGMSNTNWRMGAAKNPAKMLH